MKKVELKNAIEKEYNINTGLWIPIYIWELPDLTTIEKLVLSRIFHLDNDDDGCYANNRYFADFFGLSRTRISKIISSLATKEYVEIEVIRSTGNKRYIKSLPKITEGVLESYLNSNHQDRDKPFEQKFKHNKELNKRLMKELNKKLKKERVNANLSRFDYLNSNYPLEIKKIIRNYMLPKNELNFCINKYNQKSDINSVVNFENFISNWRVNHNKYNQAAREERAFWNRPELQRIKH